jgi:hypothetical protein
MRCSLFAVLVLAGCTTHPRVGPPAGYDRGYLLARVSQEGCAHKATCCADLQRRLESATGPSDAARAAEVLDTLAIGCPEKRATALAALASSTGGGQALPEGSVHVQYAITVGPDDRLFWAGAFVDGRYAPGTRLTAGRHALEVEVHLTPQSGPDREQLYELRASKPFELEDGQTHILTVRVTRRDGGGDAFTLDVDDLPMKLSATSAATPRASGGAAPVMHPPSELGPLATALVKVCTTPTGAVSTVEPLGALHPRHAAAVLEAVRAGSRGAGRCTNESVSLRP